MAKRTLANHNGDAGEVDVIRLLLETGAAINSLTGSDTGWDLHLHLPGQVVDPEQDGEWNPSGHTAHVQVKSQSRSRALEVKVGTLRGWVSGSQAGTPTFVFLTGYKHTSFLTPCALQTLLYATSRAELSDEDETNLQDGSWAPYDPAQFKQLLFFYTKFPHAALGGLSDTYVAEPDSLSREDAVQLIGDIFLGWAGVHYPTIMNSDESNSWTRLLTGFTKTYMAQNEDEDFVTLEADVQSYVYDSHRSEYGVNPAAYTMERDAASTREAAQDVLTWYFANTKSA